MEPAVRYRLRLRTEAPATRRRTGAARRFPRLWGAYLDVPRLRMLLDRYATYSGSDPRRAPAALLTVPWVEQAFGSWYVRGGVRRPPGGVGARAGGRGG